MKNYLAPETPENRLALSLQRIKNYKVVKVEQGVIVDILGDYATRYSAVNRCPTGFVVMTKTKFKKLRTSK